MAITVNEGGVLYELDSVYANEGGVIHELDTVQSNEGGVMYEIHSGWKFPVLGELHTTTRCSASSALSGDTYTISVYGSSAADFSVSGRTKVTIKILSYTSGTTHSNVAQINEGFYAGETTHWADGIANTAYVVKVQTGRSSYQSLERQEIVFFIEKGNYYLGFSSSRDANVYGDMKFTVKFEKA